MPKHTPKKPITVLKDMLKDARQGHGNASIVYFGEMVLEVLKDQERRLEFLQHYIQNSGRLP